jgi:hypothetical protein
MVEVLDPITINDVIVIGPPAAPLGIASAPKLDRGYNMLHRG